MICVEIHKKHYMDMLTGSKMSFLVGEVLNNSYRNKGCYTIITRFESDLVIGIGCFQCSAGGSKMIRAKKNLHQNVCCRMFWGICDAYSSTLFHKSLTLLNCGDSVDSVVKRVLMVI